MADMVTVSSRVDGWVSRRPVTDGQAIRRGQEMVVIDQRDAQLKLDELQARSAALLQQQQRTAVQLQMARTLAQDAVSAAAAQQMASAAQLEQARREFARADALVDRIVPREQWEQRQTRLHQAESEQLRAVAALADAQAKRGDIEVLSRELASLTQERQQVEVQIHERQLDVSDRQVRSPIDGVIDEKFVQAGEYVIPGQRLFMLHDPQKVWIDADIKETKLSALKPGQPVSIHVDAYPDRDFSGHIERIGNATTGEFALLPSPNPSGNFTKITQRVPVHIAVLQPRDHPLRPGMMVEVDIDTAQR
jgi:membrane fusion protein (multidrug efflux system)